MSISAIGWGLPHRKTAIKTSPLNTMLTTLINTALLGTGKQPWRPDATTPAALQTAWAALADDDSERRHYRYAALAFAYTYGGQTPAQSADGWQAVPPAPTADDRLPPEAAAILADWFAQKRRHLLRYAVARLEERGLALPTALLPEAARHSQNHPADIPEILLGARGRWLFAAAGIRPRKDEDGADYAEHEEDWQLLPFAARKAHLARLRRDDPDAAREQLAAIWGSAPANHRQDYIEILGANLGDADQPFLTAALKDRSKNVKDYARTLLMRLPESEQTQQHLAWLRERLAWQPTESGGVKKILHKLTGGGDASAWHMLDAPYSAELKAAGIAEVSPKKGESDAAYQLRQIILRLPLAAWAQFFNCDEDEAIARLAAKPRLCQAPEQIEWIHSMRDRRFTLALLPAVMSENPDTAAAHLNLETFLALDSTDRETLLADKNTAQRLLALLRHNPYGGAWRDNTHEDWGERYGLLVCNHYLKNKHYFQHDEYERVAASLPVSDTITALIETRLRLIPEDNPKHETTRIIAGHYRQKCRFAALLPSLP